MRKLKEKDGGLLGRCQRCEYKRRDPVCIPDYLF